MSRAKHNITDLGKDLQEFDTWLVELQTKAYQGLEEVERGHGNFELKKEQHQASLKAVEVEIEESK